MTEGGRVLSRQVTCSGDAPEDRLSARCYGDLAGQTSEVRVFRSYGASGGHCCGASLTHGSVKARVKGCLAPSGRRELRADLAHAAVPALAHLGVPADAGLRLLLRPGPRRWGLTAGLLAGPWGAELKAGLKLEAPGVYGWRALLRHGTPPEAHGAEVTGRVRSGSWCDIWADVGVALGSTRSTVSASVRCKGAGRLVWTYHGNDEGGGRQEASLTLQGHGGPHGLKGSLGLHHGGHALQISMSALLKGQRADLACALQRRRAPAAPTRLDLRASARLGEASFSGSARVSAELQADGGGCTPPRGTPADGTSGRSAVPRQPCVSLKVRRENKNQESCFPTEGKQKQHLHPGDVFCPPPPQQKPHRIDSVGTALCQDRGATIRGPDFPVSDSRSLSRPRGPPPTSPWPTPAAPRASAPPSRPRASRRPSSTCARPAGRASTSRLPCGTPWTRRRRWGCPPAGR